MINENLPAHLLQDVKECVSPVAHYLFIKIYFKIEYMELWGSTDDQADDLYMLDTKHTQRLQETAHNFWMCVKGLNTYW